MASPSEKGSLDSYQEYLQKKNSRENALRLFCRHSLITFIADKETIRWLDSSRTSQLWTSTTDFDYARSLFTLGKKWKEKSAVMSTSSEAYQKLLADALDMSLSRILAFKNKPPTPVELIPQSWLLPTASQSKSTKPCRSIPKPARGCLKPLLYWMIIT